MQTPPQRRGHIRARRSRLAKEVALDAGALLTTLMLLRTIVALSHDAATTQAGRLLLAATWPLVWPAAHIPGFSMGVGGRLILADLVTLALVIGVPIIGIGIIAGWESEAGG